MDTLKTIFSKNKNLSYFEKENIRNAKKRLQAAEAEARDAKKELEAAEEEVMDAMLAFDAAVTGKSVKE